MRLILHMVAFVAMLMFLLPDTLYSETKPAVKKKSDNIEKADQLGEEFQKQGPWTRQAPQDGGFYGMPQPKDYLAPPESQLPQYESENSTVQYPLCYNPYNRAYEYCYSGDSSYFQLRFRSPDFRFWWRRGRTCPPGYHFVPEEGCYRH